MGRFKKQNMNLHLLTDNNFEIDRDHIVTSRYWVANKDTLDEVLNTNGNVYLHKAQRTNSYIGGRMLGYVEIPFEGSLKKLIVFKSEDIGVGILHPHNLEPVPGAAIAYSKR